MNSVERILKCFKGEATDRVPLYDYLFQKPMFREIIGVQPTDYDIKQVIDCCKALKIDMAAALLNSADNKQPAFINAHQYVDEWGTTYHRNECAWPIDAPIAFPIADQDSFLRYQFPDPNAKGRLDSVREGVAYANGEIAVVAGINGPLTQVWMLMGPEELFYNMQAEPEFIDDLFKQTNKFLVELARSVQDTGADVFCIAEDLGASNGPMISLEMFRRFVRPCLEEILAVCKIPVMLHSCGNIYLYLDDLVDIGLDAIHPLQRTAKMDLKTVKEKYGDRITIIGNVNSSVTLPYGTPDDVEREVLECLEIGKPGGRYILASDHSLHDGIPVENIRRLFQAGWEHGKY